MPLLDAPLDACMDARPWRCRQGAQLLGLPDWADPRIMRVDAVAFAFAPPLPKVRAFLRRHCRQRSRLGSAWYPVDYPLYRHGVVALKVRQIHGHVGLTQKMRPGGFEALERWAFTDAVSQAGGGM